MEEYGAIMIYLKGETNMKADVDNPLVNNYPLNLNIIHKYYQIK